MVSVVICCHSDVLVQMVRGYLAAHKEFHIAESTDHAEVAIPATLGVKPNLVICESLQNLSALQFLQATACYVPETYFLVCGVPEKRDDFLELLHAGMRDGIPQPYTEDALRQAMDRVYRYFGNCKTTSAAEQEQQLRRLLDKRFFEDTIVTNSGSAILGNLAAMELEYQISFQKGWYQALYILLDPRPKETLHADAFLPVLQVEALAREYFRMHAETVVCYVKDHGLSILLNTATPIKDCRSLCRAFLSECAKQFKWYVGPNTITIGVGLATQRTEKLPLMMQSAKFAGWMRLSEGKGRIFTYETLYDHYMDKAEFLRGNVRDALRKSVQRLDVALCKEVVSECLNSAKNSGEFVSLALAINDVLIDAFNGYSETALVRSSKYLQLAENMPPMVENLDTTEQMQRAVISWAEACICRLRGQQEHREDTTVFAAKQYISENYTSPLRLDDVAAYVGLSTPYFCMKFRQCTGQTFVDYLTGLRVERAKDLLRTTNRKIHDIAGAVGFQDSRHFSRIFKKLCGMLPSEYRAGNAGKMIK